MACRGKNSSLVRLWTVLILLFHGAVAPAETGGFAERLESRFELFRGSGRLQAGGEALVEPRLVMALYERAGFRPLWIGGGTTASLMEWIGRSRREGLNPADYHHAALSRTDLDAVDRELLLTDALATLALHFSAGKADPARLFKVWNYRPHLADTLTVDTLLSAIRSGGIDALLTRLLPEGVYPALRAALARYREIEERGGWPTVPPGPSLRPGMRDPRVALLRRRLAIAGDWEGDAGTAAEVFDPALAEAVRRFQRRHLLEDDGIVGRRTLAALNVPVSRRIQQLRVNLERLRWLYHSLPEEFLGVDLAGFQLHLRKGGRSLWSSPIQVGKPYWQTPVFRDLVTYIDINPTWTVPRSILRRELAPRLLEDPLGFLARRDMELLLPDGRVVDPATVDWAAITPRNFPFILRQRPGPNNALGRIKFMFPNPYHVYLHDTPSKALFRRPRRAFSHGCIRVARPLELAEILLAPNGPQWNGARIQALIDSGRTRTVVLKRPMPILIVYLTAAPDSQNTGGVQFRPDLYRRDPRVLRALEQVPREKAPGLLSVDLPSGKSAAETQSIPGSGATLPADRPFPEPVGENDRRSGRLGRES